MVHPSELLRTNSFEGREFAAPTNIFGENPIDCGFTNLPCFNRCLNLEKFAKPRIFLTFLSVVAFLQGATLSYFRGTSKIWSQHYSISQENIDWMIYTNEFFIGIFALSVAYWGNRIHRISWIGGLTIFQAIACLILIIPETYRRNTDIIYTPEENLCQNSQEPAEEPEVNHVAITILIIYQIFVSMTNISLITHGITYLDDNSFDNHSPGYIGIALAAKELGKQVGIYTSGIPFIFKTHTVFISIVWICLAVTTFIAGALIAMFPRSLPLVLMRQVSASIVDIASGIEVPKKKRVVDGFFKSLLRLLKNSVLMVNIFSVVLLQSALINFSIFEKFYNQSRFEISSKTDSTLIELTTNLLQQPMVAIAIIASGMVIAKTSPKLKSLVKWNIAMLIVVILFFASTAFFKCDLDLKLEYEGILERPLCSQDCICAHTDFHPICIASRTLYSPCFAGCTSVKESNSDKVYQNCSCNGQFWTMKGFYEGREGSCNSNECYTYWTISQANRVISTALIATTFVTNLMINMRCIYTKDKAMALGLEATFVGLIPYLPVKSIYGAIAENFCKYRASGVCHFYTENLGLFLSISTIVLMCISLILACVVFILLKYKPDDQIEESHEDELSEMNNVRQDQPVVEEARGLMNPRTDGVDEVDLREDNAITNEHRVNSANSGLTTPDSLLELEDVGDDHDSVDSGPANYSLNRLNRNQIIESEF